MAGKVVADERYAGRLKRRKNVRISGNDLRRAIDESDPRVEAIAQASKVRRIGVLEPGPPWSPQDERKQDEPLRELGWVEGQNLHIERRYDNNRHEALQSLAEELMRARVE